MGVGLYKGGYIRVKGREGGVDGVQVFVEAEVARQEISEVGVGAVFQGTIVLTNVDNVAFEHSGIPVVIQMAPSKVLGPIQDFREVERVVIRLG